MENQNNRHQGLISRMNAWLISKISEDYNRRVDQRKQELFESLSGKVLEIGPGTGANLDYYPEGVALIGLEPSPHMQRYLQNKAEETGRKIKIITGVAEDIPLEDESVDSVVSTLVLCSVSDPQIALSEIKRVLKPGGQFLFLEHVAAHENRFLRIIQHLVKPLWKYIADGCRPDRETGAMIREAGFGELQMKRFKLSLPLVGPHIMGRAVKE